MSMNVVFPQAFNLIARSYNLAFSDAGFNWCWDKRTCIELFQRTRRDSRVATYAKEILGWNITKDSQCLFRVLERRRFTHLTALIENERLSINSFLLREAVAGAASDVQFVLFGPTACADLRLFLDDAARSPELMADQVDQTKGLAALPVDVASDLSAADKNSLLIAMNEDWEWCRPELSLPSIIVSQHQDFAAILERGKPASTNGSTSPKATRARRITHSEPEVLYALREMHGRIRRSQAITIPLKLETRRKSGVGAMLVADILKSKGSSVISINRDAGIAELAKKLRENTVGAMLVMSEDHDLQGIISERDISYGLAAHGEDIHKMSVKDLMTKTVITCKPTDTLASLEQIMTQRRIRHVPVKSDDRIVGIVSIGDVLKSRLSEVTLEANVLRDVAIASR